MEKGDGMDMPGNQACPKRRGCP
jgi:hypothetical protein